MVDDSEKMVDLCGFPMIYLWENQKSLNKATLRKLVMNAETTGKRWIGRLGDGSKKSHLTCTRFEDLKRPDLAQA